MRGKQALAPSRAPRAASFPLVGACGDSLELQGPFGRAVFGDPYHSWGVQMCARCGPMRASPAPGRPSTPVALAPRWHLQGGGVALADARHSQPTYAAHKRAGGSTRTTASTSIAITQGCLPMSSSLVGSARSPAVGLLLSATTLRSRYCVLPRRASGGRGRRRGCRRSRRGFGRPHI